MSITKNEIMDEFFRLAKEQGFADEVEPNPYQEDEKVIREKRVKTPEKNIIEEAHPEPIYVAEAFGDGGLVENQVEQQKKLIDMINKMPTGNLTAHYASTAIELLKIANKCDDLGHTKAADLITTAAENLLEMAEKNDLGFECPGCEKPEDQCTCDKSNDAEYCDKCDRSMENCICDKESGNEKAFPFTKAPIV